MSLSFSRRKFLSTLGAAAAAATLPGKTIGNILEPPPPALDLSHVDRRLRPAAAELRFAYAAITWGGDDRAAIKDVSETGFRGIQLRTSVLKEFGENPKGLRDLLAQHHLQMVAFSSGGVGIGAGKETDEIAKHIRNATFVRDVGGLYLQVTDSARQKGKTPEPEDYKKLGRLMAEIGKRSLDLGIPVAYHNHMNSLGEAPDEVDRIMDAADPRYLKMELDVAHYLQGGGDPVKAVHKFSGRHLFLHIKDVQSPLPGATDDLKHSYRFVELGRGKVDLPGVFAALAAIKFSGWCVVELDAVPDKARTPKEAASINKAYIEQKLKLKV
ncbi:MAG TPA: sugar phosphate isomerase/epimerase [Blastocatellia bacterium]|jgi:inosose dehydratase|nr:sugar phosphate isomerase/epimerase [Blastocatellia bacterium]